MGLTLLLTGDLTGAIAALEQAVVRVPDEPRFRGNLTRALAMLAEMQDDATTLDRLAERSGPSVQTSPPRLDAIGPEPVQPGRNDDHALVNAPSELPGSPRETAQSVATIPAPDVRAPEAVAPSTDTTGHGPADAPDQSGSTSHDPHGHEVRNGPPAGGPVAPAADDELAEPVASGLAVLEDPPSGNAETRSGGSPATSTSPEVPVPALNAGDAVGSNGAGLDWVSSGSKAPPGGPQVGGGRLLLGSSSPPPMIVTIDGIRFVQTGAYDARQTAEVQAARLGSLTEHPARVSEVRATGGRTLFRVRIGPVTSYDELAELARKLSAAGYGSMRLRPRSHAPSQAEHTHGRAAFDPSPPVPTATEKAPTYVQVGAFAERGNAATLADEVRTLTDQPVYISEALSANGEAIYRVRVASAGSLAETKGHLEAVGVLEATPSTASPGAPGVAASDAPERDVPTSR